MAATATADFTVRFIIEPFCRPARSPVGQSAVSSTLTTIDMTYCATVRAFLQTMALSARQKVLQKHVQLTNFPINQSVSAGSSNASVGNNESANM